jgi:RimJ/RimL family protein N-acetyltransferase
MNSVPVLEKNNLRLIPYGREHDQQTVNWLNSAELRETFGLTRTITLESHRQWIESSRDVLKWAIFDECQVHCGNVLLHCTWSHLSAYFQIYLGNSQARGRRIGSTILGVVLHHAFHNLSLHRVWLHTLMGNVRAERMYEKAGFVQEGIERDAILREGIFHSQARWSLLANEWSSENQSSLP